MLSEITAAKVIADMFSVITWALGEDFAPALALDVDLVERSAGLS